MKSLLLIGGGGHCNSCIDVRDYKTFKIKGVIDSKASLGHVLGYPVIGSNEDLPQLLKVSELALVTVGQIKNPKIRIKLFEHSKQLGAKLAIVVSPKAHFSKHSIIGEGSIIMHGAIVNAGAQIEITVLWTAKPC